MERGDVYLVNLELPNRRTGSGTVIKDKLVIALQGGLAFASMSDVAVVVASTHRSSSTRRFEVLVGVAEGFQHDTIIDGRWPFTIPKSVLANGRYLFQLTPDVMKKVSLALVHGLQMGP